MIRVAFRYDDPRAFARLVRLIQGGDCAHCEVSYAWEGLTHMCVSSSFLDGGVREHTIVMPPSKWRIYEIKSGYTYEVLEYLDKHRGEKYDWLGLLGFVFRRIKGFSKRKFCSECAAEIIGLKDPWRYDLSLLESVVDKLGVRVQ